MERKITTSSPHSEEKPGNSETGSSRDVAKTSKNIRSFYSTHQSSFDAHPSDAASKAAAMWPNAASVQARKRAEEEAARKQAPNGNRASEATKEQPTAGQKPEEAAEEQTPAKPQPEEAAEPQQPEASEPHGSAHETRDPASEAHGSSTQHSEKVAASKDADREEKQEEGDSPRKEAGTPKTAAPYGSASRPKEAASKATAAHNPRTAHEHMPEPKKPKQGKPSHGSHAQPKRLPKDAQGSRYKKGLAIGGAVGIALIALIVAIVVLMPITVTVNGQEVQIAGAKNLSAAIDKAGLQPTAGNFLAVDGSVITEGGGQPFDATVDDQATSDPNYGLSDGAVIAVSDGSDVTEDFTVTTAEAPFTATVDGTGAIHTLSGTGQNGTSEVKTGNVSGLQATTITEDPVNIVCTYHNADVGDQKVVALTFDDGPNANYTPQILDVLERNGASATFFTVGSRIEADCVEIVQRAYNAGHQICTHSWDHAAGSGNGVDLSHMTKEEQIDEILKGYEAIEAAIGAEASHIIRTPGGNFPPEVITNLSPYITTEMGWNIDTQDWTRPGVAAIKAQILAAQPGDIILMHDGGGDRSQTVQALSETLPVLKSRGFRFVTVDQLLEIAAANG